MKLAQRFVLGYYKTKINTLAKISLQKAMKSAFKLFCTPYSGKPKREQPAIFHKAEKLQLIVDDINVNGFRWEAREEAAPIILIVHGFDSCSYRFESYIPLLHSKGFTVLAFDAPGHGISGGKLINAPLYQRVVTEIYKTFGPLHGIMAHSFGGLATVLFAEELQNQNLKIVLIAPATETRTAIKQFFRQLKFTASLEPVFTKWIEAFANKPIDYYSITRAIQNIKSPVLWLHDEGDRICPYEDTGIVRNLHLPNIEFVTTKDMGHSKIYRDREVMKKIVEFF